MTILTIHTFNFISPFSFPQFNSLTCLSSGKIIDNSFYMWFLRVSHFGDSRVKVVEVRKDSAKQVKTFKQIFPNIYFYCHILIVASVFLNKSKSDYFFPQQTLNQFAHLCLLSSVFLFPKVICPEIESGLVWLMESHVKKYYGIPVAPV